MQHSTLTDQSFQSLHSALQMIHLFESSIYFTILIPPLFQDTHDLTLLFRSHEDGATVSHLWIHGTISPKSYQIYIQSPKEFKSAYLSGWLVLMIWIITEAAERYFIFLDNAFHSDDSHLHWHWRNARQQSQSQSVWAWGSILLSLDF
mgnify:CR=1 FL=1